jgi:large subunit ribosomal protein L23
MKNPDTILKGIQVTEKGTKLLETQNTYLFRVAPSANKLEIKRAVEQHFHVAVARVNTMTYRGKRKRERTVRYGKRTDWKRAVVTLKEGSKIDLT